MAPVNDLRTDRPVARYAIQGALAFLLLWGTVVATGCVGRSYLVDADPKEWAVAARTRDACVDATRESDGEGVTLHFSKIALVPTPVLSVAGGSVRVRGTPTNHTYNAGIALGVIAGIGISIGVPIVLSEAFAPRADYIDMGSIMAVALGGFAGTGAVSLFAIGAHHPPERASPEDCEPAR